jgi:RimJ/RimL family protein N-acetyltransferase
MSQTPRLCGAGAVLRPLHLEDAPALFIALSDPRVQLYRRHDAHGDVAATARYIADTLAGSRLAWAITEDGGEALGRLALREPEAGVGEFGIVIRRAAQGKGLGTRSLALAEAFAFHQLGFTVLKASINAQNQASLALFKKRGFVQTAFIAGAGAGPGAARDSIIVSKPPPSL